MKNIYESIGWHVTLLAQLKGLVTNIILVLRSVGFSEDHPVFLSIGVVEAKLNELVVATEEEKILSEKEAKDHLRDSWFYDIIGIIKASLRSMRPEKREAAELLWKVFGELDSSLPSLSLVDESQQLKLLKERWNNQACQDALATLDLTTSYTELYRAEQDLLDYTVQYTAQVHVGSNNAKQIRKELIDCTRELLDLTRSLANLQNDTVCVEAVKRINKLLSDQDTLNKHRLSSKKRKKEEENE